MDETVYVVNHRNEVIDTRYDKVIAAPPDPKLARAIAQNANLARRHLKDTTHAG